MTIQQEHLLASIFKHEDFVPVELIQEVEYASKLASVHDIPFPASFVILMASPYKRKIDEIQQAEEDKEARKKAAAEVKKAIAADKAAEKEVAIAAEKEAADKEPAKV